jgi:hypothetical protein
MRLPFSVEVRGLLVSETATLSLSNLRHRKSNSAGRLTRSIAKPSGRHAGSQRAADFIELATEAATFRLLPESLLHFSRRVAQILSADWCGVVVLGGGLPELHSAVSPE